MDRRQILASATALATMTLFARGAGAQAYPTKPIKVIVPFGAGSTTDVIANRIAQMPDVPTVAETYPRVQFLRLVRHTGAGAYAQAHPRTAARRHSQSDGDAGDEEADRDPGPAGVRLGPDEFASLMKNAMPQWKETIEATGTKAG